MKINRITLTVFAYMGVAVSPFVVAQEFGRGFSLNPGGGYYAFDSELNIDDEIFPALGLEYRFTRAMAVELSYIDGKTTEERNDLAQFDVQQLRLDGHYYFNDAQKFQPYLSAGVGMFDLSQKLKNISREDTVADVGAGVRYFFNQHFSLRTDLRAMNNIDSGYTDGLFNIGLNLLLGAEADSTEADIDLVQGNLDGVGVDDGSIGDGLADQGAENAIMADADQDCLEAGEGLMLDENGCAIPIESTVSMDLNVNFPFESAELPAEFYSDVKELATFLKLYNDSVVTIEGHADATGPVTYNLQLSERRAKAIRDILVNDFDIERDRLKLIGYGEGKPVASNETEKGRQQNRRAATVVTATRQPTLDSE